MTAYVVLRALVMLKRIHRAMMKANEIAEARLNLERERLALDHPQWYKAGGKIPTGSKFKGVTRPTVEDWNERYREHHPDADQDTF